ncbi:MAG: hypothetical protein AVDCRST_MAG91-325, partial [uncultured Sphingomonadaceae bacterium]
SRWRSRFGGPGCRPTRPTRDYSSRSPPASGHGAS